MAIKFNCAKCQQYYEVANELAGKPSRCKCGQMMQIPVVSSAPIPLSGSAAIQPAVSPSISPSATAAPSSFDTSQNSIVGNVNANDTITSTLPVDSISNFQPTISNPNILAPALSSDHISAHEPTTNKTKLITIIASVLGSIIIVSAIGLFVLFANTDNSPSELTPDSPVATVPNQSDSNFPTNSEQGSQTQDADTTFEYSDAPYGDYDNPFETGETPKTDNVNLLGNTDGSEPASTDSQPPPSNGSSSKPIVATDVYQSIAKLSLPLPKYVGAERAEDRTWKSVDEKFSVTGTFNGLKQDLEEVSVTIETSAELVSIPLSLLCVEDRNWIYRHAQYDYMRHIRGVHSDIANDFRRYTPSDYETPTPFDVDWITDMPELWGPLSTVNLRKDKKELSQGKYNQKYITLEGGFLEALDYWKLTTDGKGWISNFTQGSESIELVWNKEFVDSQLGGYTTRTLQKVCLEILAEKYPDLFDALIRRYAALNPVDFFEKVIPVFFETSVTGKLVDDVLYAKSFTLTIRNVLGGVHISADDEIGYRQVFYKDLMEWLVKVRARVAMGTDLDGNGTIMSAEHGIGYYEEIDGDGVNISELVNHLRGLAALGNLNRKINKFTRMVVQFKQVDQNNDDRIKPDDYAGTYFATHLELETIKEAFTLKEDERAILSVLLTAGIRPKFYVHFADKFGPAMLSLSFSVRSKEATDTNNPYKGQTKGRVTAMINEKSPNQAAFADAVFDLLKRKELDHFRSFVKPHPVNGVLQYSDLKEYQYNGVYRDQITELGWITGHVQLLDSKLVDIVSLNVGAKALPSGDGHIYRYSGPQGTLNIWVDGILERNFSVRGIFWDHSISEEMDTHLWTWKERDVEYDIHGKLVNVLFIGDKIMMVIEAEDGEVTAIPIYRMPREMRRFARWALAFFRTDKFYHLHDRHDRLPFSLVSSTGASTSRILLEADQKWGNRDGKASRLEITIAFYYDTGKTVQFDAKEAAQTGVQVGAVRDLPPTITPAEPFLNGLINYETEIASPITEQIYQEISEMFAPTQDNKDNFP
jgi:hypothetical protein